MKPQDVLFILIFLLLLITRKQSLFTLLGLLCLLLAVPLFMHRIFFTAEHLVWYAAAFFFTSSLFLLFTKNKVQ